MMNAARRVRSKSPFVRARRSRSKSPFGSHRQRDNTGTFPRRRSGADGFDDDGLHESEINIFQQLCLDRHDDSAAIEILLDDSSPEVSQAADIPDLFTASSGSTERSPHPLSHRTPGSMERKRTFLNRIFKSPLKSPLKRSTPRETKLPKTSDKSLPESQCSEPSDDLNYLPKPPSNVSKTRERGNLSVPIPMSNPVLSEMFDTFSNMSEISGSRASTLKSPVKLDRHESLGTDSIKDIRKALKEMEKQLGQASTQGTRVSRQKVMRALFTVADSLEDMDERELLQKELEGLMRTEREETHQKVRPLMIASSDDDKSDITRSDDEEDFTRTSVSVYEDRTSISVYEDVEEQTQEKENGKFSVFSSVGKLFGMSANEKRAVEQVLDDLLWTEFVTSRNHDKKVDGDTASLSQPSSGPLSSSRKAKSRNRQTKRKKSESKAKQEMNRLPLQQASLNRPRLEPPERSPSELQRARSWWRRHPTTSSKFDVPSFDDDEDDDDYDDDDDFESVLSDEFPDYLPKSITVRDGQRHLESKDKSNFSGFSPTNPRYRAKLVDTESRYGYEMGSTSSSTK